MDTRLQTSYMRRITHKTKINLNKMDKVGEKYQSYQIIKNLTYSQLID